VAENYPQLRATENFQQLQAELANTEDRLQSARRFYNNNVQGYNRRIQAFPSNMVASMFGFKEEEFFHVDEALRQAGAPRVEFGAEAAPVQFMGSPSPSPQGAPPGSGPAPAPPAEPGTGSTRPEGFSG
jgi:LemA protein